MRNNTYSDVSMFRKFLRVLKKLALYFLKKVVNFVMFCSERTRTESELRNYINRYNDEYYLRRNYSKLISEISFGKLNHLDIGSHGGPLEIVQKYSDYFEIIMCEPIEEEADKLLRRGYKIINKPMFKEPKEVVFYETQLSAGSSIYKPKGPYLDFYNPDPDYLALYDTIKETPMLCSTISDELSKLGIRELDFLKLDTQGSELDILKGAGNYRPLMIMTEVQYLPFYNGVPSTYEVCQYLIELGYIPFTLTSSLARNLCPTYGDGIFMPSWVEFKGVELIRAREEKYIALMLMFGQIDILKFVNRKIKLKNQRFIESL